jgi:hypothetical protein
VLSNALHQKIKRIQQIQELLRQTLADIKLPSVLGNMKW